MENTEENKNGRGEKQWELCNNKERLGKEKKSVTLSLLVFSS